MILLFFMFVNVFGIFYARRASSSKPPRKIFQSYNFAHMTDHLVPRMMNGHYPTTTTMGFYPSYLTNSTIVNVSKLNIGCGPAFLKPEDTCYQVINSNNNITSIGYVSNLSSRNMYMMISECYGINVANVSITYNSTNKSLVIYNKPLDGFNFTKLNVWIGNTTNNKSQPFEWPSYDNTNYITISNVSNVTLISMYAYINGDKCYDNSASYDKFSYILLYCVTGLYLILNL